MKNFNHITVLLKEAVNNLTIKPDGIYVDCTLGGGGHTKEILKRLDSGKLYAFDQDKSAITYNQNNLPDYIASGKLELIESNFNNLKAELNERGVSRVDGVLYDLGVSSPQFDDANRGFSYRFDTALDMRMDQKQDLTAKDIINDWSYKDLVRIFFRYGEEKYAKSIARRIEFVRQTQPILTTGQLVDIIKQSIPAKEKRKKGHPAKKVFQALRIAVNNELDVLEESLLQALDILKISGRISVITFQSLEDRLVKTIFREYSSVPPIPKGIPMLLEEQKPNFRLIFKKPILPSLNEIEQNNRAHSAKLRVIERINSR